MNKVHLAFHAQDSPLTCYKHEITGCFHAKLTYCHTINKAFFIRHIISYFVINSHTALPATYIPYCIPVF